MDDTDSPEGGCTTYLAALLIETLLNMGATLTGYPTLLRLNPNTPWKTRGNASICIRIEIDDSKYKLVQGKVMRLIEKYGEFQCENTNPGAVFLKGHVPDEITDYSASVVQSIVSKKTALNIINDNKLDYLEYKNGRGIIGALAAIGGTLCDDFTFELLTYRARENLGTPRQVDLESIIRMNEALQGYTYNNLDENGKPMITPRGPDPVLYGVRGESPKAVFKAKEMIKSLEPVDRWIIFKTNQGTDQHFGEPIKISRLQAHNPAVVHGIVDSIPKTIEGGHVFFKLIDETGSVTCAAYEPTGSFRRTVRKLRPRDEVSTYSGVSIHGDAFTLNLEKIEVHKVSPEYLELKPKCPECGGSTESMGKDQGLRCKKCGYRDHNLKEEAVMVERDLVQGIYLPDRSAHRHLTKPYERYGREKKNVRACSKN
jgi:tRNA(Ile2)-agmatinylcytidine synthase